VAGASIPVINVLDVIPNPVLKILSAILATIIVVASGLGKLFKYQEN